MPKPIIFNRDIQTKYIFSFMPHLQLIQHVFKPINKQCRRLALIELFSRQSNRARYLQLTYLDYIFHHHDQISRIDFQNILNQSGILKHPLALQEPMKSLLFGAIFYRDTNAAIQLIAYSLADLQWDKLYGEATHAKAVKALISVYCLSAADSVRDFIFDSVVRGIDGPNMPSMMHCEMLGYLGPYLIRKHLHAAYNILEKTEALLIDQQFGFNNPIVPGLNIPSFSNLAVLLCNQRQSGRPNMARALFEQLKINSPSRVPERLLARVLGDMHRCLPLPHVDQKNDFKDTIQYIESILLRNQSLAYYSDESNQLMHAAFASSTCSNPNILFILANLEKLLTTYSDPLESFLFSFILSVREYCSERQQPLADDQLHQTFLFIASHFESTPQPESRVLMAHLLAVVLNKRLIKLTNEMQFSCLYQFIHVAFTLPRISSLVYEYLDSKSFQGDYLDLFETLRMADHNKSINLIDLMCFSARTHPTELYFTKFSEIITRLDEESHQIIFTKCMEELKYDAFDFKTTRNALYLLACSAHDLSIDEVRKLFDFLQLTWGFNSRELHLMQISYFWVPLLHFFKNLTAEVISELKLPLEQIVDGFISVILKDILEYPVFGRYLIAVQPVLTEDQTKTILTDYALRLKVSRSRKLFEYPEYLVCPSLVAALAHNLRPSHNEVLKSIPQQSNHLIHQLLLNSANHEHRKRILDLRALAIQLRQAIQSTPGYVNRMKAGIFCGLPTAPFREMLRLVDVMESGEVDPHAMLTELHKIAMRLNARSVLSITEDAFEYVEIIPGRSFNLK